MFLCLSFFLSQTLRFSQLPRFEEVLNRTMQLVKPGGWLLLEDVETVFKEDAGLLPGQEAFKQFQQHRTAKGVNPRTASALQGIIESSKLFSEVNVKKIVLPISKCDETEMGELNSPHSLGTYLLMISMCFLIDIGVRRITESFRNIMRKAVQEAKDSDEANCLSSEVIEAVEEEINNPSRELQMEVHMTWSRRDS